MVSRNVICFCKFENLFICECDVNPVDFASLSPIVKEKVKEYTKKSLKNAEIEQAFKMKSIGGEISRMLNTNKELFVASQHQNFRGVIFKDINERMGRLINQQRKDQKVFMKVKKKIKRFSKFLKLHNNNYQTSQILTKVLHKLGVFLYSVFRPNKLIIFECITKHMSSSIINTFPEFSSSGLICKNDKDSFFYLKMKHNISDWIFENMIINFSKKTVDFISHCNFSQFQTSNLVRVNQKIYVFGGVDQNRSILVFSEYYDVERKVWVRICPLPKPDYSFSSTLLGNYLLIASRYFKYCIFYDPEFDKYYEANYDGNRDEKILASVTISNNAYLIGSRNICYYDQNYNFVELFANTVFNMHTKIRDSVVIDDKAYLLTVDNNVFCLAPHDFTLQRICELG
jgi:hypothetical protein